ncbi:hypothetical protein [Thermoplasma sp. Kam2015]|uniref:hypothetical protein n=1 Tax=Thermoplasma sp. Kam2015 TaxID=2094122 RepID=UPI001F2DF84C|nr:hypothetical protein [Thermoplasma sp. Kam2015]
MESKLPENRRIMEVILDTLQNGEQSISGIAGVLKANDFKMHRIMLSGYLKALVDVGILRERRIKPVTLYSVLKRQDLSIYEITGNTIRTSVNRMDGDLALKLLHSILRRPIFLTEIERCGTKKPMNFETVIWERRKELIKKLSESGIMIPDTDMLVIPRETVNDATVDLLSALIGQLIDLKKYTIPDNDRKQKTLDL